jgi:hypothetical protein
VKSEAGDRFFAKVRHYGRDSGTVRFFGGGFDKQTVRAGIAG